MKVFHHKMIMKLLQKKIQNMITFLNKRKITIIIIITIKIKKDMHIANH
jgi:hypothetical protein